MPVRADSSDSVTPFASRMARSFAIAIFSGDDLAGVVIGVLEKAAPSEGDLVTLYWGEPVTEGEAGNIERDVSAAFQDIELELVEGGQPHYHFVISIE